MFTNQNYLLFFNSGIVARFCSERVRTFRGVARSNLQKDAPTLALLEILLSCSPGSRPVRENRRPVTWEAAMLEEMPVLLV